eukprot:12633199-Alexandrium_andersonii.AAC.1
MHEPLQPHERSCESQRAATRDVQRGMQSRDRTSKRSRKYIPRWGPQSTRDARAPDRGYQPCRWPPPAPQRSLNSSRRKGST